MTMPNNEHSNKDKVTFYKAKLERLRESLRRDIPELDKVLSDAFSKTCDLVVSAAAVRDAADKARRNIPDDDDHKKEKDNADEFYDQSQKILDDALEVNIAAAQPVLDGIDLLASKINNADLLQCAILIHGTPENLGAFADQGPDEAALIDNLLANETLTRTILFAGGAKNGNYGEAMKIYNNIQSQSSEFWKHAILQRLALGTALEHAVPMSERWTPTVIDPVQRYFHFEQAYLAGELDDTFADRTVWEFRLIADSDAPSDQLEWGRRMLRNYRPDEIFLESYVWRYCMSVRTEVGYRTPEWTSEPHTYQQLISGGGKCGPRAFFGRFICKSFGIPTWGARQPGHAMLHHWTPNGWIGVLGADWKFSSWEGRCGPNFFLETQARESDNFFDQSRLLHYVGDVLNEKPLDAMTVFGNSKSIWKSLALMAEKILAAKHARQDQITKNTPQNSTVTDHIQQGVGQIDNDEDYSIVHNDEDYSIVHNDEDYSIVHNDEDYSIVHSNEDMTVGNKMIIIPAACCSSPSKTTKNITFMKSYLGGQQLHHREGDVFEYILPKLVEGGNYQMTLRICNVHLKQTQLLLTIQSDSGNEDAIAITNIPIQYTIGEWQYTDPVTVQLATGLNILSFTRETPNFGLTIKDIIFTC